MTLRDRPDVMNKRHHENTDRAGLSGESRNRNHGDRLLTPRPPSLLLES